MSQALDYMLLLILVEGYDFSEALYKSSDLYKVPHNALQEAYDAVY